MITSNISADSPSCLDLFRLISENSEFSSALTLIDSAKSNASMNTPASLFNNKGARLVMLFFQQLDKLVPDKAAANNLKRKALETLPADLNNPSKFSFFQYLPKQPSSATIQSCYQILIKNSNDWQKVRQLAHY